MGRKPKVKQVKKNQTRLIVKGNKLINARYRFNVSEMRMFLAMITQITREDTDFKTYRIQIADFLESIGTSSNSVYERAQETSKRLLEQPLIIEEDDGPLQLNLISSAKYYRGRGYVDLQFDPKLRPYLLQLKEKFTAYDIRNVLRLQSGHSIRIYELLKQYETIGERTFQIDDLKEILGVADQYTRYNDFKRFVILQAQKELIEYCDIRFTFQEIKQGRKIDRIHFTIEQQRNGKAENEPQVIQQKDALLVEMTRMGLSPTQAHSFLGDKSRKAIEAALTYTKKRYKETKGTDAEIRNIAAYLIKVLESDSSGVSAFEETENEKEAAAQKKKEEKWKTRQEKEKEMQVLKEMWEGYHQQRNAQILRRAEQVSAEDWDDFETYARQNIYLSKKLVKNGELKRDDENIGFWLGSYLLDREKPDNDQAFMDWAYRSHGIQLVPENNGEEVPFKIVGKQNSLF